MNFVEFHLALTADAKSTQEIVLQFEKITVDVETECSYLATAEAKVAINAYFADNEGVK